MVRYSNYLAFGIGSFCLLVTTFERGEAKEIINVSSLTIKNYKEAQK
jgi:hypothetical protein